MTKIGPTKEPGDCQNGKQFILMERVSALERVRLEVSIWIWRLSKSNPETIGKKSEFGAAEFARRTLIWRLQIIRTKLEKSTQTRTQRRTKAENSAITERAPYPSASKNYRIKWKVFGKIIWTWKIRLIMHEKRGTVFFINPKDAGW